MSGSKGTNPRAPKNSHKLSLCHALHYNAWNAAPKLEVEHSHAKQYSLELEENHRGHFVLRRRIGHLARAISACGCARRLDVEEIGVRLAAFD